MFQKYLCFFFFIVSFFTSTAQLQVAHMDEAILSTSDRTYLTFGQGIGNYKTPYGIKPLNPLIFEGQISPDFFLRLSKKRTIGMAVFPKIIIRMFNQPSMPVKTPSYMPSILFYHQLNIPFANQLFRFFSSDEQMAFMTYRAIHHSNGQEGNYYLTGTDSVNYRNGNFSTNAVEIAFSWSAVDSGRVGKSFANGRIAYERQLDIERETELRHTYYYDKISLESRFIYSEKVKAYIKYSVMWGTAKFRPRNSVDLFLAFKPFKKLSNFSIFMRGYIGPDYYNLYYENMLRTITLGIIADPLSIPVFQKVKNKK